MAVAGLVIGAVGLGLQVYGQMQQTKALKQAEADRQKQMNLDATRQRRQIARTAVMARSTALANATAQGAAGGSGLQGGYGQIEGQSGGQLLAVNQNQAIGQDIFKANQKYYNASVFTDIGSGMFSMGQGFMQNAGQISRVGASGWGF